MARILIAGCGLTGTATAKALLADGHEVYGLKRHPPPDTEGMRYIKADLGVPEDLAGMNTDFDLVIYMLSPDARDVLSYQRVYVDGLNNLLDEFSHHQSAARFMFVSSTSVYGQSHGQWVDESSTTDPHSPTAKIILQAEQIVRANSKQNCIVRFSGIYGRGRSHLIDAVINKREVQFDPPYYMNRIHWQDCVGVIYFIANRMISGEHLASVYLASDDDPAPKWDVFMFIADRLGVTPPEKALLPPDTAQNKRCSNRLLKQLGYRFKFSSYKLALSELKPSDVVK